MRATLDVSHLPTLAVDGRSNVWWGNAWMIVIESMVFGLSVTSYYYIRMNQAVWPPPGASVPSWPLPTLNMAIMLGAAAAAWWTDRAARVLDKGATVFRSLVLLAIATVHLVIRIGLWRTLNFDWAAHAYGSLVWGLLAMHTLHLVTGILEVTAITVLMIRPPDHEKDFLDVRCSVVYWYFIACWWVVLWFVLYVSPHVVNP